MIYRQRAAILNIFSVFVTAQMIHAQTSQIREYVYLGGKVVGIESPPPPLIVTSLSATKKTFSTSTDSGSLTVTTNGAAPWRVTNIPTWISVTTGSYPCAGGGTDWCGTGTATIPLSVQANTSGTARMTRFKIVDPSSIPEVLVSQAASGISSPIVLSGSVPTAGPGQQRFEFVIHNPSGAANINFVQIIARRTWTTTDACFIHYTHGTGGHEVGLASDETFSNVPSIPYWVAFGTVGTGSSTPISNRQCTISPNDVSTINDGNLLT